MKARKSIAIILIVAILIMVLPLGVVLASDDIDAASDIKSEELLNKLDEYEKEAEESDALLKDIENLRNIIEDDYRPITQDIEEEKEPVLTFEVIADTHIITDDDNDLTNNKLIGMLDHLKEDFPETSLVMNCGDFTNNGTEIQMRTYFNMLKRYDSDFTFMTGLGNHDVREYNWAEASERYIRHNNTYMGDTGGKVYHDQWIEGYHFIMMNTEWSLNLQSYISPEQLDWLDKTMDENTDPNKPIFVGLHQPLKDTFGISNEWPAGVQDHKIKEVLRKYPQTVLFTGHLHDGIGLEESKVLETDFGTMVNVPGLKDNSQGQPQGQLGFHISVYDDEVKIDLRDYLNNKWVSEHSYTIDLDPFSPPIGKILEVDFNDGTAIDRSGYGNNGEIVGNPEFVEGINGGKAIHIVNQPDDSNKDKQYVKFGEIKNLNDEGFTIMLTYKGSLSGDQKESIISNTVTDANQNISEFNIGNFKGTPGIALSSNSLSRRQDTTEHFDWTEDGKWHAVAAVYEKSGEMTLYIDGKKAESKKINLEDDERLEDEMFNLILGADGNLKNGAKDIYIDELKVYKQALGSAEIETTWGPFNLESGTNHITISWKNSSFDGTNYRSMEPGYLLLDGKRIVDIKSGDTSATITHIKSNQLYHVNLVTNRKNNRSRLVDVYDLEIRTKKSDINKDVLLGLYNVHKDKSPDEYTEESWIAFDAIMAEADQVFINTEATQKEIEEVTDELALIVEKLEKIGSWEKDDTVYRYKKPNDNYAINEWIEINEERYHFDERGYMQTGWLKLGSTWYYMDHSGAMQTGWTKVGNSWYYMNNSGIMQNGWLKLNSKWYYLNSSGAMQTGWLKLGSIWYYMNSSGAMETDWAKVGNTWYYMSSSGAMQTDWVKLGSTWYYMNNNGVMQIGWTKVGNTWYYMNNSGIMQTGWLKLGGSWYYLKSSGAMQTGWAKISNKEYYFYPSGVMR